jgi:hypothetical protein
LRESSSKLFVRARPKAAPRERLESGGRVSTGGG